MRWFRSLLACSLLGTLSLGPMGAFADDDAGTSAVPPPAPALNDGTFLVPDVRRLSGAAAAGVLARSGLNVARVYERRHAERYVLGSVVRQRPEAGVRVSYGFGVDIELMAAVDGPALGRPADPSWPRAANSSPPPTSPAPRPVGTAERGAREPAPLAPTGAPPPVLPSTPPAPPAPPDPVSGVPAVESPGTPASPSPSPSPSAAPSASPSPSPLPMPPPAVGPVVPGPASASPAAVPAAPVDAGPAPSPAVPEGSTGPLGSPDAPAVAPRGTPGEVPDLVGLALTDADQRAREAGLVLYVERVPGHPVGRVLEQVPEPGARRSVGSPIKVVATAGGDTEGAVVPVPRVAVVRVSVPELLDRSPLQAGRILEDLGLVMKEERAVNGLPGRVVDQKPGPGTEVAKGSLVTVWVTPPPAKPPSPFPSAAPAPSALPGAAPTPPANLGAIGVPLAVSPSEGTALPKLRSLPVGFTWTPVEGAEAYILEVEESSAGAWISSLRKPVRSSAATLDVERVAANPGDLRWRVRALLGGREGAPCAWVVLR